MARLFPDPAPRTQTGYSIRVKPCNPRSERDFSEQKEHIIWRRENAWSIGECLYPRWRHKIKSDSIETIIRPYLPRCGIRLGSDISIKLSREDPASLSWTISSRGDGDSAVVKCILKLCMPIDPWYRTESEVATMQYLRQNTGIPIPEVYAFDSSGDNALGLEWILMEKMPGKPYGICEGTLSLNQRADVMKTIQDWDRQLFECSFEKIGSLFCDWNEPSPQFYIGRSVDWKFTRERRLSYDVSRGPYQSIEDYLLSYLNLMESQITDGLQQKYVERSEVDQTDLWWNANMENEGGDGDWTVQSDNNIDEEAGMHEGEDGDWMVQSDNNIDEEADMHEVLSFIDDGGSLPDYYSVECLDEVGRMREMLPKLLRQLFARDIEEPWKTHLHSPGMNENDVLVDENGTVTGLLNWEMISALPRALLPRLPKIAPEVLQPASDNRKIKYILMGYPIYTDTDPSSSDPSELGYVEDIRIEMKISDLSELDYVEDIRIEMKRGLGRRKWLWRMENIWAMEPETPTVEAIRALSARVLNLPRRLENTSKWMKKGDKYLAELEEDYVMEWVDATAAANSKIRC